MRQNAIGMQSTYGCFGKFRAWRERLRFRDERMTADIILELCVSSLLTPALYHNVRYAFGLKSQKEAVVSPPKWSQMFQYGRSCAACHVHRWASLCETGLCSTKPRELSLPTGIFWRNIVIMYDFPLQKTDIFGECTKNTSQDSVGRYRHS